MYLYTFSIETYRSILIFPFPIQFILQCDENVTKTKGVGLDNEQILHKVSEAIGSNL